VRVMTMHDPSRALPVGPELASASGGTGPHWS
jgi:hypothetical protein